MDVNFNYTHGISKHEANYEMQNTGKDGLSGPSEFGVYTGDPKPITTTLGGGYYFIPPIPNRKIAVIGEQFLRL